MFKEKLRIEFLTKISSECVIWAKIQSHSPWSQWWHLPPLGNRRYKFAEEPPTSTRKVDSYFQKIMFKDKLICTAAESMLTRHSMKHDFLFDKMTVVPSWFLSLLFPSSHVHVQENKGITVNVLSPFAKKEFANV